VSNPLCDVGGVMNNEKIINDDQPVINVALKITDLNAPPAQPKAKRRPRVALETELETIAAGWPAAKRFEMARKFKRWARQLKVSGFILFHESHPVSQPKLRSVGIRKARLN
jgi:hypothetical protein